MEKTELKSYFGVPVLLQLKIPIIVPNVKEKHRLPHTENTKDPQWVIEECLESETPPVFSSVQSIRYAVLYEVGGSEDNIEVRWLIPGLASGAQTVMGTLLSPKDIAFVTRVVTVGEGSPLIIAKT